MSQENFILKVVASAWFSSFKNMEISFLNSYTRKRTLPLESTLHYNKRINCFALLLIHRKDVEKAEL